LPVSTKRARGTFRKDRAGNAGREPQVGALDKVPPAPKCLGRIGRAKWDETGGLLTGLGLLTELDVDALEVYCAAWDEVRECDAEIKTSGAFFTAESGYIGQHPAVVRRHKALDVIRRFQSEFGMTAAARTKVVVAQKPTGVRSRAREVKGGKRR
jgi:P27 family predicted phage terminase small subunit